MRHLALLGLVYCFVGCLSFEDTGLRVGVSYDHREGVVEGSQQFFPSATARVEENPIYGGWVEIDFPLGDPAVRPVELTNWRDLKADPVSSPFLISAPSAPSPVPVISNEAQKGSGKFKFFGVELPENPVILAMLIIGIVALGIFGHKMKPLLKSKESSGK